MLTDRELIEMVNNYLEAAAWTAEGDDFPAGSEWSEDARDRAVVACNDFLTACEAAGLAGALAELPPFRCRDGKYPPHAAMGHDLWLTRNGHGTGFWDREDYYGDVEAATLDRLAHHMGESDAYIGDDGLAYLT